MKPRAVVLFAVIALFGALAGGVAHAQDEPGKRWEERHDLGNRYEGPLEVPVSKSGLELLSFVGYQEEIERGVELTVWFYLPMEAPATVHARHLKETTRYFMKSKPVYWHAGEWNRFGPWPTGDVLDPEEIDGWDVGVYVDLAAEDEVALAPALIFHSEPPSGIDAYTLQLGPDEPLTRLDIIVVRAEDETETPVLQDRLSRAMRVGEPILLDLPAAELPEGWLRVEVVGKIKNRTEKARFDMRFFHRAEVEPPGR